MFTDTFYQEYIGHSRNDVHAWLTKHITVTNIAKVVLFLVCVIIVALVTIVGSVALIAMLALNKQDIMDEMDIMDETDTDFDDNNYLSEEDLVGHNLVQLKELGYYLGLTDEDVRGYGRLSQENTWRKAILSNHG